MDKLVGTAEVAAWLCTSREQVRNMIRRGQLPPPMRVPGVGLRWRAGDLREWLGGHERRAA